MEAVKRWLSVLWHFLVRCAKFIDGAARVVGAVSLVVVVGVAVFIWWDRVGGGADEREALRVAERAKSAAEVAKKVVAPDCPCSAGARCTGKSGGVYCFNESGKKKYF